MKVTIFLPVSRDTYLQPVFSALEHLDCDRANTNLLVLVDGKSDLFVQARNLTEGSKFDQRLCVMRKPDRGFRQLDRLRRRRRIAQIHNEAKQYVQACDYVLLVEDDTIVPAHTLQALLRDYSMHPFAGMIEGVELGRHSLAHVGAWRADDVYETSKIESLMPGTGTEEIDAGGFYCALTKWDNYKRHEFAPYGNNDLGPDVNYGLWLRREGFKNYIDWSVRCEHRIAVDKGLTLGNTNPQQVIMEKEGNKWRCIVK